jgi:GNAT superfamily N-acetyltransferase
MRLVTVDGEGLEGVLDWTYPIWNEGLTRDAYSRWNRGQMATPWGRGHLRRVGLHDGRELVASAKRYDFSARLDGRVTGVLGIGAVFTPEAGRGRGHAQALLAAMIDDARSRGCTHALLFSEIGAAFYERAGFRAIPQALVELEIRPGSRAGAPAVLVRSGETHDLEDVAAMSAMRSEGAAFALDRTADLIGFGITRKRLLAGLGPPHLRSLEFFVTEEGRRAVAYVMLTRDANGWLLQDCGDRDPSLARVGAMLQALAARTPADGPMRLRAWLPPGAPPPQVRVVATNRMAELMMLRPIDDVAGWAPPAGNATYSPVLDAF